MQMYTASVEVAGRGYSAEDALEVLTNHHASVGTSPRGWDQAIISIPAENLAQATSTALALVGRALEAEPIACEVMTEAEFDARQGWAPAPTEVMSVTEVAAELGVSRQAVLQQIDSHKLPATKVGRSWTIPRSAVQARQGSPADGQAAQDPA